LPPSTRTARQQQGDFINPPQQHIDKGFDAFMSSPAWKRFRAQVAAERGERCQDKEHDDTKSRTANVELDHIVELADGGAALDRSNVMFRCHSCHVRKTIREKSDRSEREYWERRLRLKGG
jgi:5-methylcytosine-specific restriction endonuclease McrA